MSQPSDCPLDHALVRTVLVVEDEALIRISICEDLRDCGFDVLEASSAPQALALLESEATVDFVFSDIQMPGYIDGLGLARWIFSRRPDVRIVLTSAACSPNDLPQELRQSIPIVAKPYDLSTVLRHLRETARCTVRRDIGRRHHLQLVHVRAEPAAATGLARSQLERDRGPRPLGGGRAQIAQS
jgi:CheY-like chemotaxis protein